VPKTLDDQERELRRGRVLDNSTAKDILEHRIALGLVKYPQVARYLVQSYTRLSGRIFKKRRMEQILLYGKGILHVYKPVTDNEGIDLIVVKNGVFQPVFLQVKGGFTLHTNNVFICDIRMKTFKPHHCYFVIGAFFNPKTLELHDKVLFVPTETVEKKGVEVRARNEIRRRITTRLSEETQSKWSPYIIDKKDIANKIFEKFQEIEKYLK
jgi:hypothetical protein